MTPHRPGTDLFLWVLGAAFITALFKTGQVINEHEAAIATLRGLPLRPQIADATAHLNQLLMMLRDANLHPDLNSLALNWLNIHLEQPPSINDWNEFLNHLKLLEVNKDGLSRLGDAFVKYFPPKGGSGSGGPNLIPG